ncbi:hypothetical protein N0V83_000167 [Neocucurbitaria cava]|uniref:Luciferase n=1 Tax=Neocucurbitaria cava TaxID=798079 RepID=A0A9W8YJB6_9PLEO|nr:hypothetical protein N0V83_000167 [Neocucurbitaria cava]
MPFSARAHTFGPSKIRKFGKPGAAIPRYESGNAGIDLSQYDIDQEITPNDVSVDGRVHPLVNSLKYHGNDISSWTPRKIGKAVSLGGNGSVPVGSAATVADAFEEWIEIADLDGFNVGYVTSPGSFEDLVDLLVPELRRRGSAEVKYKITRIAISDILIG